SAIMQPSDKFTNPLGPVTKTGFDPLISPDCLTGGVKPIFRLSVLEISTCVCSRAGPTTRTPLISPRGPDIVTFSSQAYCPGCDISRYFVSLYPLPKSVSISLGCKCICRAE